MVRPAWCSRPPGNVNETIQRAELVLSLLRKNWASYIAANDLLVWRMHLLYDAIKAIPQAYEQFGFSEKYNKCYDTLLAEYWKLMSVIHTYDDITFDFEMRGIATIKTWSNNEAIFRLFRIRSGKW